MILLCLLVIQVKQFIKLKQPSRRVSTGPSYIAFRELKFFDHHEHSEVHEQLDTSLKKVILLALCIPTSVALFASS